MDSGVVPDRVSLVYCTARGWKRRGSESGDEGVANPRKLNSAGGETRTAYSR